MKSKNKNYVPLPGYTEPLSHETPNPHSFLDFPKYSVHLGSDGLPNVGFQQTLLDQYPHQVSRSSMVRTQM